MKALSLRQPWATLVAIGAKKIETRSWRTGYRGPLAIHASATFGPTETHLCDGEPFHCALLSIGSMPLGAVVAIVDLVDVEAITAANTPQEPERSFGDYGPGRWAWRLENVRRLAPAIAVRGHLGLWTWEIPDIYRDQVEAVLDAPITGVREAGTGEGT